MINVLGLSYDSGYRGFATTVCSVAIVERGKIIEDASGAAISCHTCNFNSFYHLYLNFTKASRNRFLSSGNSRLSIVGRLAPMMPLVDN